MSTRIGQQGPALSIPTGALSTAGDLVSQLRGNLPTPSGAPQPMPEKSEVQIKAEKALEAFERANTPAQPAAPAVAPASPPVVEAAPADVRQPARPEAQDAPKAAAPAPPEAEPAPAPRATPAAQAPQESRSKRGRPASAEVRQRQIDAAIEDLMERIAEADGKGGQVTAGLSPALTVIFEEAYWLLQQKARQSGRVKTRGVGSRAAIAGRALALGLVELARREDLPEILGTLERVDPGLLRQADEQAEG